MTAYTDAPRLMDIGGRRLAVQIQGAGPVVVLEQGGASAGVGIYWNGIDRGIAEFATVVTYDRAGLGYSDPPPFRPTVRDMADDLARLLDALPVEGPFVLAGWSLGGLLTEYFAASRPEAVAGLVLVDPTPTDQPEILATVSPVTRRVMGAMGAAQGFAGRKGLFATRPGRAAIRRMLAPHTANVPAAIRDTLIIDELAKPVTYQRLQLMTARLDESCAQTHQLLAEGGLPDVPLTVLSAPERGKGLAARLGQLIAESHERLAASVPGGKRVVIDGASHQLPLERPEIVVDAVRQALQQGRS